MKKIITILSVFILMFAFISCDETENTEDINSDISSSTTEDFVTASPESEMVDEVVYPHDEVIDVNISISLADYNDMIENATDEEYHECDITYNGYTLENVAIRTKGNSSLRDVYQAGGDRFSLNVDLNLYEDQDLFGIDKIILNNMYMDPTMMAEYLTYEALDSLGAVSSRTTYVALYINDVYFGLYLSVEQVGNEFLDNSFGNSDGELYKPDSGTGSNLNYISDTFNYSGLVDKFAEDETDNEAIIELMKRIESGEDLDEVFNVDGYLKYLAVSTYTVNLDSYQAGMYHNYYLYNNNGVFEWIAWDLNMAFNGFPMVNLTDLEAIVYLIDEPTANSVSSYPLIYTVLNNDEYLETYHEYMQELIDNYFEPDNFEKRVNEVADLIDEYVKNDPSSFYTYAEYQSALYTTGYSTYSIIQFVEERTDNVQKQLDGVIPSTNNGEGNEINSGSSGRPPR